MHPTDLPISEIRLGRRYRQDMGDLQSLADSIREDGLLHPVVITPGRELIAGQRRLLACRDILKWTTIPVRVVDIQSLLRGELNENVVRKDFTPTEKLAIFQAVRDAAGERRGRPKKSEINGHNRATFPPGEIPHNCAELNGESAAAPNGAPASEINRHRGDDLPPGVETREVAARVAGFGSREDARRVAEVVAKGTPALVAAMDEGKIAVSMAAQLAKLPAAEQDHCVAAMAAGKNPDEAPPGDDDEELPGDAGPLTDPAGTPIPPQAAEAFAGLPEVRKLCREMDAAARTVEALAPDLEALALRIKAFGDTPQAAIMSCDSAAAAVAKARRLVREAAEEARQGRKTVHMGRPGYVCPICRGAREDCHFCHGKGFVGVGAYELSHAGPPKLRKAKADAEGDE